MEWKSWGRGKENKTVKKTAGARLLPNGSVAHRLQMREQAEDATELASEVLPD